MDIFSIDEHITAIDHLLIARPGVGVTYVVRGEDIALVETGTSQTVQHTLAGLERLGIAREAVSHIICTHVHMDHAGGAGFLAEALPRAHVYIHSATAEHLIDPSRLIPSVERAVGEEAWPYHGTVKPIAPERIRHSEALRLDLGRDVVLEGVPTPGHSPDHVAYRDLKSGGVFIGDATSVSMGRLNITFPVTPPPAYNMTKHLETVAMLRGQDISRFYVTHYGAYDDVAGLLSLTEEQIQALYAMVCTALDNEQPIDVRTMSHQWLPYDPADPDSIIARTWGEMSVNGMQRYERKRREKAAQASG